MVAPLLCWYLTPVFEPSQLKLILNNTFNSNSIIFGIKSKLLLFMEQSLFIFFSDAFGGEAFLNVM